MLTVLAGEVIHNTLLNILYGHYYKSIVSFTYCDPVSIDIHIVQLLATLPHATHTMVATVCCMKHVAEGSSKTALPIYERESETRLKV